MKRSILPSALILAAAGLMIVPAAAENEPNAQLAQAGPGYQGGGMGGQGPGMQQRQPGMMGQGQGQGQGMQSGQPGMMGQGQGMQSGQPGMMGQGRMGGDMMGGPRRGGRMGMMRMGGHMMKIMFAIADTDGDGALSFEEVTAVHRRIFNAVDANHDGRVTPDEFRAFLQD